MSTTQPDKKDTDMTTRCTRYGVITDYPSYQVFDSLDDARAFIKNDAKSWATQGDLDKLSGLDIGDESHGYEIVDAADYDSVYEQVTQLVADVKGRFETIRKEFRAKNYIPGDYDDTVLAMLASELTGLVRWWLPSSVDC